MSKLDLVMEIAKSEVKKREGKEMAHTDHTDYSDTVLVLIN